MRTYGSSHGSPEPQRLTEGDMKRVKRLSMACPTCGPGVSVAAQARKALSAKTGSSKRSGNTGCSFRSRQRVSSDSSEDPSKTSRRRPNATAYTWNLALDLHASPEATLFLSRADGSRCFAFE